MPQPLSNPDLRRRNLVLLLETLLQSGDSTRKRAEQLSGLSKATVSRLVDELIDLGLVESTPATDEALGRGRRPDYLSVPARLGQVIGISFGVRRTVVRANDLANRSLFHMTEATPEFASAKDVIAWLSEQIAAAQSHSTAPLRSIVIAVPARVVDGEISHPPLWMSVLESQPITARLTEIFRVRVALESDANMALAGLVAQGTAPQNEGQLLLNMGTVLTVACRRSDGSFVLGRSDAYGDFSLLPYHSAAGNSTLGAMLSTYGLERYCAQLGLGLSTLPELWEQDVRAHDIARTAFADALAQALRVLCVTIDPPLLLLVGRLTPLVERVLPEVIARLEREFSGLPTILSLPLFGTSYSPAHGAVHTALGHARAQLHDQLLRGSDALLHRA